MGHYACGNGNMFRTEIEELSIIFKLKLLCSNYIIWFGVPFNSYMVKSRLRIYSFTRHSLKIINQFHTLISTSLGRAGKNESTGIRTRTKLCTSRAHYYLTTGAEICSREQGQHFATHTENRLFVYAEELK